MALAPQNEDAFFREVDDEVRRDRMLGFGQRYGRLVAGAVIVGLIALAAWLYWQHRSEERAGAQAEALSQALAEAGTGNPSATPKFAQLAAAGDPGYAAAARVAQAGLAAGKGDAKAAAVALGGVAGDTRAPQQFRDLALIRQTTLEFDTLPPATVISRLAPFAAPGNPWFGSAGELTALAYIKQNKPAEAARMFAAIAQDGQVPETIRARAQRIAGMLGVEVTAVPAGANAR